MARSRSRSLIGIAALVMGGAACDSSNPASPGPGPGPGQTPITLASLSVSTAEVDGGASLEGTATLSGAAPAGGTLVSLSSSSPSATVPASITVAAGATSATFSITTSQVAARTTVTILGSSGGANRSATLSILAPGAVPGSEVPLASLQARHDDLIGGDDTSATITLSDPAPAGGVTLRMSSDDAAVEVPAELTIAAGARSGTFRIRTEPVAAARTATVTVTAVVAGLRTASATLTIQIRLLPEGNELPVAADDSATVNEDAALTVPAPGVLDNDADADGDPLTAVLVDDVTHGALTLSADGSFTYTPDADFDGVDTFTYRANDGAANSNTATVTITVTNINDLPTISDVADQTIDEDTSTGALPVAVGDIETAAGSLTMSGSSSNTTLVPDANIIFGGSDGNRTVTVTPAANAFGSTTITVTVSDGTASADDTFLLTVDSVNDAPTISAIADQTINGNLEGPPNDTGFIPFTVDDVDNPASSLNVSANASGTPVWVVFGGSGSNRTVRVSAVNTHTGTATIELTVSDGITTTTETFLVFVLGAGLLSTAIPRRRRRKK